MRKRSRYTRGMEDQNGTSGDPGNDGNGPESLLPYDAWTEAALRQVTAHALAYVAENGLQGGHHFYITFHTDYPGVDIPARLKAQYPQEMTIVLEHQFWDLSVDEQSGVFSVGLSFGGIPSTLRIPLAAISSFVDPYVQFGLQFHVAPDAEDEGLEEEEDEAPPSSTTPQPLGEAAVPSSDETPQVISLDAFRRRSTPKE